jgi:hypothetical protein
MQVETEINEMDVEKVKVGRSPSPSTPFRTTFKGVASIGCSPSTR